MGAYLVVDETPPGVLHTRCAVAPSVAPLLTLLFVDAAPSSRAESVL
jgi:hypothetical protein